MPELELSKPKGCMAEAHYSLATKVFGGNERLTTAEFMGICSSQLGPLQETIRYNVFFPHEGERALAELKARCSESLSRLITPFCVSCPNNLSPKEKS